MGIKKQKCHECRSEGGEESLVVSQNPFATLNVVQAALNIVQATLNIVQATLNIVQALAHGDMVCGKPN